MIASRFRAQFSRIVGTLFGRLGYRLVQSSALAEPALVVDIAEDSGFNPIYQRCRPYSRTSASRLYALWLATRYLTQSGIPGAFVECGVWRGGSMMLAALALVGCGTSDRDLWLYDTYDGMTPPTDRDVDFRGRSATEDLSRQSKSRDSLWLAASMEDVQANLGSTGYPAERLKFIKGKVEDTLPAQVPDQIALLRLDTDWYDSTRHELEQLYPRLVPGGVLIVDDYGHWQGARRAVDEYFAKTNETILLNRIDYTGRIAVKLGEVKK